MRNISVILYILVCVARIAFYRGWPVSHAPPTWRRSFEPMSISRNTKSSP